MQFVLRIISLVWTTTRYWPLSQLSTNRFIGGMQVTRGHLANKEYKKCHAVVNNHQASYRGHRLIFQCKIEGYKSMGPASEMVMHRYTMFKSSWFVLSIMEQHQSLAMLKHGHHTSVSFMALCIISPQAHYKYQYETLQL